MVFRSVATTLFCSMAWAHPGGLQCGDERFEVGSATKCMTLDIIDKQEHPGLRLEVDSDSYSPGTEVHMTFDVVSPGPYDNSTGQDPYGIYFAVLASAAKSNDYGSFTALPDTVSAKDVDTCPHQVFSTSDDTAKDTVGLTWVAGSETCGDVSFSVLWGNGPGDAPKAPDAPFLFRSIVTISGAPCQVPVTTTTAEPAGETWTCSVCGHVYDADIDGAGAAFEDLPDDWICPVCLQPKSVYQKQAVADETWTCSVCGHVYDAEQDGAGVAFEDLPEDWLCPICAQPKSVYEKQASGCVPCSAVPSCQNCCGPCGGYETSV